MNPQEATPSPCINVCKLDEDGGVCVGCLRTAHEISEWSDLTDEEKRRVIAALPRRKARMTALASATVNR